MNRFIVYLFGFLLLAQANALACNFKISNFGDPKENVKLEGPQPISMPDQFGGESLLFPIIDVCKNDKSFDGTMLIYLYIENKLSQIQLYRPNMQDTKLMDFAMNNYGKFNLTRRLTKINVAWKLSMGDLVMILLNILKQIFMTDMLRL